MNNDNFKDGIPICRCHNCLYKNGSNCSNTIKCHGVDHPKGTEIKIDGMIFLRGHFFSYDRYKPSEEFISEIRDVGFLKIEDFEIE